MQNYTYYEDIHFENCTKFCQIVCEVKSIFTSSITSVISILEMIKVLKHFLQENIMYDSMFVFQRPCEQTINW